MFLLDDLLVPCSVIETANRITSFYRPSIEKDAAVSRLFAQDFARFGIGRYAMAIVFEMDLLLLN